MFLQLDHISITFIQISSTHLTADDKWTLLWQLSQRFLGEQALFCILLQYTGYLYPSKGRLVNKEDVKKKVYACGTMLSRLIVGIVTGTIYKRHVFFFYRKIMLSACCWYSMFKFF